jgi:transcriptional regulator with XRE-family HTH domain
MVEQEQGQFDIASIGERLRLAREAKSMSLDDVANRTRIPIRHLQHIETEEWDALPAVTYAIGFTRNYANVVGLDGAELAAELRERIGGPRNRAPATQYYEQADPARVPPRSLAILAAIVAILLAAAYFLWPAPARDGPAEVAIVEVGTAPGPAPAAPAAVTPPGAAGQAVILTATGEVWVRISDGAGGPILFSGSLAPGQTYAIPAGARRPVIRTGRPQLLRARVGATDIGPLEPAERTVDNVSLLAQDLAARAPR